MPDPTCLLCAVYRPASPPRLAQRPPVCADDRQRLDRHLAELPDLHQRLMAPESPTADQHRYRIPGQRPDRPIDPLAAFGGAGPVPGRSGRPRVSGSRDPVAPVPLDRVDLVLPARAATRRQLARGALGLDDDQTGHLSTSTILDTWVRDWRASHFPDQPLPADTTPALTDWLRRRLEHACDRHPAIDEFATEIRQLRSALRRTLGEAEPPARIRRYDGLTCLACDLRGVLMQRPGEAAVECGACGARFAGTEVARWIAGKAGPTIHSSGRPDGKPFE